MKAPNKETSFTLDYKSACLPFFIFMDRSQYKVLG